MTDSTIVIAAHDRPEPLRGLAGSLGRAKIDEGTRLVVSIDGGGTNQVEVRAIADSIEWPFGPKQVIEHSPLGLVEHFFRCGDLTETFGNIVLLEDDLVVGPAFQQWANEALSHSADDDRIAGVSLATPWFDGYRQLGFEPIIDGGDGVYMQIPWYDGMAWTPGMWKLFRSWLPDSGIHVHKSLDSLRDDEWFPNAIRYLVATQRWFLMPRHAHATNTGAAGAHFDEPTNFFQAPISMRPPKTWNLLGLDDSLAVYDDHMELAAQSLERQVPDLVGGDIAIDLLGVRDLSHVDAPLVLTTRLVSAPIRTWGASMHPLVANVVYDVPGTAISLAARENVHSDRASDAASLATLRSHASRGRAPTIGQSLKSVTTELTRKLRRG